MTSLEVSREAYNLGFQLTSFLLVSSHPKFRDSGEDDFPEVEEVRPNIGRLLRLFDVRLAFDPPKDHRRLAAFANEALADNRYAIECTQALKFRHGSRTAGYFKFGHFVAWFTLGQVQEPSRIQIETRQAVVNAAKEIGLHEQYLEDALNSPNPVREIDAIVEASGAIFLVHGHNHSIRDALEHYLRELGLQTYVMDTEANLGQTLPEKFERSVDNCRFAVFIITADDQLVTKRDGTTIRRARQNVILEVGYFWGRLGRTSNIAFLVEDITGMELPSDLHGIGWIPITPDLTETKTRLRRELVAAKILRE